MLDAIYKIVAAIATLATVVLGAFSLERASKIKRLKQEIEDLKRKILRTSSKVNPETDRIIIKEAKSAVQILGINALGPLHHCREELIDFLAFPQHRLQLLLLDSRSDVFKARAKKEDDNVGRIMHEWQASIRILKDISMKTKGKIELHLHNEQPDRALLIVDALNKINDYSKIVINYYPKEKGMRGYSGEQFLSEYILERDRDSFYKNYDHFQKVWSQSNSVEIDRLLDETEKIR